MSDLEATLAEVLAEHGTVWRVTGPWKCWCGEDVIAATVTYQEAKQAHAAHVAAVLAPVVADAVARAVEAAAVRVEDHAAETGAKWLRPDYEAAARVVREGGRP